jgi:hypothetical protein
LRALPRQRSERERLVFSLDEKVGRLICVKQN